MITLKIAKSELTRLLYNAEKNINSGHWGNSILEIPDEQIILNKLKIADESIELSMREIEIVINWFNVVTDHGLLMILEDMSIIQQITYKLFKHYEDKLLEYNNELSRISKILSLITNIMPDIDKKMNISRLKELDKNENEKIINKLRESIYGSTSSEKNKKPEEVDSNINYTKNIIPEHKKTIKDNSSFIQNLISLFRLPADENEMKEKKITSKELLRKTENIAKKINKIK